jgi:hypothetical protein
MACREGSSWACTGAAPPNKTITENREAVIRENCKQRTDTRREGKTVFTKAENWLLIEQARSEPRRDRFGPRKSHSGIQSFFLGNGVYAPRNQNP